MTQIWGIENTDIVLSVELADTVWKRFKGLMMRKEMPSGQALFLHKTNSIHMCFMYFPIDAVYVDNRKHIVKIVRNLPAWTGISACLKADSVLEMKAGEAKLLGLAVGMQWKEKTDLRIEE